MTENRLGTAIAGLQWGMAIVILTEASLFLMGPNAGPQFSKSHMPGLLRWLLGGGEIVGSILLFIPRTISFAGWLLVSIFLLAIVTHLLHGMPNVGSLVIYAAAAWVLAVSNNRSPRSAGGAR